MKGEVKKAGELFFTSPSLFCYTDCHYQMTEASMKQATRQTLAKIALFTAALIWGSSFFIVKNTVNILPPNVLLSIRFFLGSMVLTFVFFNRLKKINREYWISGSLIGIFLFLGYCIQTLGLVGTTPGKNAFLTAVYCVIVPFLYWALDRTKPKNDQFLAAFICIVGIGFVSLDANLTMVYGDALTLVSGFCYSFQIVLIAKFAKDKDPIMLTLIQFIVAGVLSWITALIFEPIPSSLPSESVFPLIYLVVVATAGALALQNVGQKHTDPSSAAIILSLEAVFGVLFSIIFYGEQLNFKLFLGFALIFIAILISEGVIKMINYKNT
jgi:drug/metabolite transporter (DMT)-like permease